MLSQINALSLSPVKVFSILIFHLLIHLNRADSQVVGPHQPVVALVDDDVILPCHVEPAEDVTAEILEWTRSDLNPRFVHVWRSGQDLVNTRNPSYRGRASLFINELKRGNISLKLSRVKLSDGGTYECSIPLMEKKSFVKLVVDAATSPVISLSGIDKNRGGVVLQCESAGWYPEPELLWLDGEGNLLSAGPTETLRGPDDLYTVSSRVTVEKRHSNNITCRVQQRNTNQSRETHIHVPEDFFEIPSSASAVIIGLAVSLALCILLLILSATIKSETAEFIKKLMEIFPTLDSKWKKKDKINNQLQQLKVAAEKLKNQLQSKNQQMIKSEMELDEFIQKVLQKFPTLESKVSESISQHTEWKKNTDNSKKLQDVKQAAENLKAELESRSRAECPPSGAKCPPPGSSCSSELREGQARQVSRVELFQSERRRENKGGLQIVLSEIVQRRLKSLLPPQGHSGTAQPANKETAAGRTDALGTYYMLQSLIEQKRVLSVSKHELPDYLTAHQ
ncbi:butyrophilin subfamily 2 member A2-like [Neolamprologus brichardi]|uniref:butyrophilin subfamily 2 member A2-like n=1 Tax=Neolamprologus brichardi TaxID=32507 RepID=UPI001643715F|nr:butyrophilin subfamily 2 member A2-like [Neolamprologus brichardi]